jgi:tellurite resistance protein
MAAPSDDERFNLEVMKLLLKLARADNEVAKHERQMILGAGRSWNVSEPELQKLMKTLDGGGPLPEPDLKVLKARSDDVLTAARALVLSDGKVKAEETALLKQLAETLAGA